MISAKLFVLLFCGWCIVIMSKASDANPIDLEKIRQSARNLEKATPKLKTDRSPEKNQLETNNPKETIEEIKVYGTIDPEDVEKPEKLPLKKMRDKLDKSARVRGTVVVEGKRNDGTRHAQIDVGDSRFCITSSTGQIDFSGIGRAQSGMAFRQRPGKECF